MADGPNIKARFNCSLSLGFALNVDEVENPTSFAKIADALMPHDKTFQVGGCLET
jgi:hypothetical protein